jgi:hypothetical protein
MRIGSKGERILSAILLGLVALRLFVFHALQSPIDSFWYSDYRLYFALLADPEHFAWTAKPAYNAITMAPSWFLDVARWFVSSGFDATNPSHVAAWMSSSYALGAVTVTLALYHSARAAGARKSFALVAVLVALAAVPITSAGRLFSLYSLFESAYLSLTVNALCVLAMSFYLRGWWIASGLLVGFVCNFHSVTAPMAGLYIGAGLVWEWHRSGRRNFTSLLSFGLSGLAVGWPFLLKAVQLKLPRMDVDAATLQAYSLHRSANPFPLSDGLAKITVQTIGLVAIYWIAWELKRARKSPEPGLSRALALCVGLGTTYWFQLVFAEVGWTWVMTGCFHRLSPMIWVLYFGLVGALLQSLADRGKWEQLTLLVGVLALHGYTAWGSGIRSIFPRSLALAAITLLGLRGSVPRKRWLQGGAVLGMLLGAGYVAEAAQALLKGSSRVDSVLRPLYSSSAPSLGAALSALALSALVLGVIAGLRRFRKLRSRLLPERAGWALFVLFFLAANAKWISPGLSFEHGWPRPKFKPHPDDAALEFLRANTRGEDHVFVPFPVDMVGVRRQFLDWRHEWYILYTKEGLSHLMEKARALDMDVGSLDSITMRDCPRWKRLLIERCISEHPHLLQRVYGSHPWLPRLPEILKAEPGVSHVLVKAAEYDPGKIPLPVAARSDAFVLLRTR